MLRWLNMTVYRSSEQTLLGRCMRCVRDDRSLSRLYPVPRRLQHPCEGCAAHTLDTFARAVSIHLTRP